MGSGHRRKPEAPCGIVDCKTGIAWMFGGGKDGVGGGGLC